MRVDCKSMISIDEGWLWSMEVHTAIELSEARDAFLHDGTLLDGFTYEMPSFVERAIMQEEYEAKRITLADVHRFCVEYGLTVVVPDTTDNNS